MDSLVSLDLLSKYRLGALAAATVVLYYVAGGVYRLYFSPVAKFPGPKLAALTLWYEFYYDVVKRGQYTFKIKELHEQYGPIVRINPWELHINDPDFYDEIYVGPGKRNDKWPWSAKMFGFSTGVFSTIDHDHHRLRRGALAPFFSKRAVMKLEPLVQGNVDLLCARFREFQKTGEPVNLTLAFSALTTDVISEYSFARSYNNLSDPAFAPEYYEALLGPSELTMLIKQCGWLVPFLFNMPEWLVQRTNPSMMKLINLQKDYEASIRAIIDGKTDTNRTASHTTIFQDMYEGNLPPHEKTMRRLVDEGQTLIGAGTLTTAHMLRTTSYYLLANPESLAKLKAELNEAMPDLSKSPPVSKLEQLPYLSAVVNEGLRISYGVSHRLQRVMPDRSLKFHDWVIPPGTPVSMTGMLIHDNPDVFLEPRAFKPERWLGEKGKQLERYLVPFSRGSRACIGMSLAFSEIYLTMAAVFRRFEMELYETTEEDVRVVHDFVNPCPRLDSKGVRVTIHELK
ncbi:MAG: hypothetical protein M1832_003620 [Thelocarpon impressellum]|nr:MAG: hypothetical protein M1832_003620 [Thelocarpon impressellum]